MDYSLFQNSGSPVPPPEVFHDQLQTMDYWMAEVIYFYIQHRKNMIGMW